MKRQSILKIFGLTSQLLCLAVFSGCIATSKEVSELSDDIEELRVQISAMNKNQADLSLKMDSVDRNMGNLKEKLDDNKTRMSTLSKRMDDIHSSLGQRMDVLSQQLSGAPLQVDPTPSELYKLTYGDYSKGKYDLAIVGFRSFLERYPDSELASNAQYYLSDSYYNKNDYAKAKQEYETLNGNFSNSDFVPSSKYKIGLCLTELKKPNEAKVIFEQVIKDYPQSTEAEQSKEKLKSLGVVKKSQ
ncbi:MAG: tol-pal system protein YbgF [Elusimicrobia bacterium RIFOXYA2_FULL_39_19]|nr:MAG: tol-pal system protein YbgF [Elusimicrobia bacterium RIFOXYA2_FULL_39_19]